MNVGSLRDLRRLLGHPEGSWLLGEDLLARKGRVRRWILAHDWSGGPHAVALPRTSQADPEALSGWLHGPHDAGHQVDCCIDLIGRVLLKPQTLRAGEIERYCCHEPDAELVAWVVRHGRAR